MATCDRPEAANGRRSDRWGTLAVCPACGQCLCFACHPRGPCLDEPEAGWYGRHEPQLSERSTS